MRNIKQHPTQQQLQEAFYYQDGLLYRRSTGKSVGTISSRQYKTVSYQGSNYLLHRIIYIICNGAIPNGYIIDHIDSDASNNVVDNLQAITVAENNQKQKRLVSTNASGYRGVSYVKRLGRYTASIRYNNRNIFLGNFKDRIEAAKAYDAAALEHYKSFANLNFPLAAAQANG